MVEGIGTFPIAHSHTHTQTRPCAGADLPSATPSHINTQDVTHPMEHTCVPSHIRGTVTCAAGGSGATGRDREGPPPLWPSHDPWFCAGADREHAWHCYPAMQGTVPASGDQKKHSKPCEYGGTRSPGAPWSRSGAPYPSCVPRSTKQDLPREPRLFPILLRSLGFSPQAKNGCALPPCSPSPPPWNPTGWGLEGPPGFLPPSHLLCPQYKPTHGHKVLCNLFMALLPDPAARGRILSSAAPADPCPFSCPVQAEQYVDEPIHVSQRWRPHQILLGGPTRMLCDVRFHTAAMPSHTPTPTHTHRET